MSTFVVSDLHLFDHSNSFLFNAKKEQAFIQLCEAVITGNGKLVFAGDIFDFTGMTPCRFGLQQFFTEAVPASKINPKIIAHVCRMRSTEELLIGVKSAFPGFFAALTKLCAEQRLIYVVGNHDCDFFQESGRDIFSRIVGDGVKWQKDFVIPGRLIVSHGNEFDPSNQTTRGCHNPGFIFTSALYQGIIPALRMHGIEELVLEAIPAVRPEEATVSGIEHYLGDESCRKILVALARLLQRNGFFHGIGVVPAWFLSHNIPFISRKFRLGVTPERVRAILPHEQLLIDDARRGAKRLRTQWMIANPANTNAVIVLGHTHEFDTLPDYVNLGTWINHITGLLPTDISSAELALPVFHLKDSGEAVVYNVLSLGESRDLALCPVMWKSP